MSGHLHAWNEEDGKTMNDPPTSPGQFNRAWHHRRYATRGVNRPKSIPHGHCGATKSGFSATVSDDAAAPALGTLGHIAFGFGKRFVKRIWLHPPITPNFYGRSLPFGGRVVSTAAKCCRFEQLR